MKREIEFFNFCRHNEQIKELPRCPYLREDNEYCTRYDEPLKTDDRYYDFDYGRDIFVVYCCEACIKEG